MTAMPNRISAFAPLSSEQEAALAQELLELQSEAELDHFLPFILPALKLAAPLLKSVAGSLLGGLGGGGEAPRPRRARNQQEYFLGKMVRGLFGEVAPESEQEERFLGGILKGLLGEQELQGEQEQFIGSLLGKLFGGRELEVQGENYVQEQFLGSLIGKLFRGGREMEMAQAEMEQEVANGGAPSPWRLRLARRFVRLAHEASRRAAHQMAGLGRRPAPEEARRIVFGAIVGAARHFTPRLAAAAFGGAPNGYPANAAPSPQPPTGAQEYEMAGPGRRGAARAGGVRGCRGHDGPIPYGTAGWVRRGNCLILTF